MGYFKPLRRKIGVVTLVTACLLSGLWIRCHSTFDEVTLVGRNSYLALHFNNLNFGSHGICCRHCRIIDRDNPPRTGWTSSPNDYTAERLRQPVEKRAQSMTSFEAKSQHFWSKEWCGIAIEGNDYCLQAVVPYWSIVTPMTLLSAWLLLSRPRTKSHSGPTHVQDSTGISFELAMTGKAH